MTQLPEVTIICVDCYNYGLATAALQKCNQQVKAARTVLLTDIVLKIDGIEVVQIPTISSKEEYSHFIIKELHKYFNTAFVLIIQHDGTILDGNMWDNDFLNYDYIGAPWLYTDGKNVGNGGFSLRSRKLQKALSEDDFIQATDPEDQAIGRLYRDYLIKQHGIKFPSEEVADKFSFELREPMSKTFGFHGYFHQPFKETVVIKRSAAIGDVLIMEPVLRYYATKGFNVVVDIPIQFYPLFQNHYFPVKHISQFDKGRIPARYINLDMAYEVKPNQNYLQSYFEFCGIEDYELTRPQLFPLVNEKTKPFKKYCIVHIDQRETTHRNVYGVEWKRIQWHLDGLGYTVIQVGSNDHEECGIHLNTKDNLGSLKFFIAGCDLFLGIDSSPAGIAMAYNKPCILMFGSVNPEYIHPNLDNAIVIQQKCVHQNCWHIVGGTAGKPCVFDELRPPCCVSSTEEVINAINKMHRYE